MTTKTDPRLEKLQAASAEAARLRRELEQADRARAKASVAAAEKRMKEDAERREKAFEEAEPQSSWELDLEAKLAYLSSAPEVIRLNPTVAKSVSHLRMELDTFRAVRRVRYKKGLEATDPNRPHYLLASERLASPDDALFVVGRGNGPRAVGTVNAGVLNPGVTHIAARGEVVALPQTWLAAGLRESIAALRDKAREKRLKSPDYAVMTAERESSLLRAVDDEIGFLVEGADRWNLPALAARYYGRPAADAGLQLELVKAAECSRMRVRWLREGFGDSLRPPRGDMSFERARAWWAEQEEASHAAE